MTPIRLQLLNARYERGLRLSQAADLSGIHYATISAIEKGKQTPTMETLEALLDAYGYTIKIQPAHSVA